MKIIDLSQPLYHESPAYPFDPPPSVRLICSTEKGDGANTEAVAMTLHCGTHMDAPFHFFGEGRKLSDYNLDDFAGDAAVLDVASAGDDGPVPAELLDRAESVNGQPITPGEIVLLRTGWGELRAKTDRWLHHSSYLTRDGAEWLVSRGVKGVGIDHFSVGTTDAAKDRPPHEVLLGHGVWIVEDLYLPESLLKRPRWKFLVLPLKFIGTSGAPARAIVIDG